MTANQLRYWQNVETERSNRAREEESFRSNVSREGIDTRRIDLDYILRNVANAISQDRNAISREEMAQRAPLISAQALSNMANARLSDAKRHSELASWENLLGGVLANDMDSSAGNIVNWYNSLFTTVDGQTMDPLNGLIHNAFGYSFRDLFE